MAVQAKVLQRKPVGLKIASRLGSLCSGFARCGGDIALLHAGLAMTAAVRDGHSL